MLQIQLVVREADLNPGPLDYKSVSLTTRPHYLPPVFIGTMSPIFAFEERTNLVLIVLCPMARIEMDCNLKKLANFFKFFLRILKRSLKS